jgi:hypothetical protein
MSPSSFDPRLRWSRPASETGGRETAVPVRGGFDLGAGGAYVSPDGKYLFFALRDDIWWVDARVIEDLRPES